MSFFRPLLLSAVCSLSLAAQAQSTSQVQAWITSADRTSLLAKQANAPVFSAAAASTGPIIAVDDTKKFQSMDGFGFALTGGSAQLLMQMSPARRTAVLKELFATGPGSIDVSYIRVTIGASDMNEHVFTYDDMPAGSLDPKLEHFSLGPDLQDVVPVLKEIVKIQPGISILASPWSAPSWMKTNQLPKAGSLKWDWYPAYAQYFVKYLQAMAAQGIPIRALTMQNEPLNANNTPSMIMTAGDQSKFLAEALGPALKQANLHTEVILYDHNCDKPDYPLDILKHDKAAQYATGSGFHLYEGNIDALTKVHDAHPDKGLYFTEQMVIQPDASKPLHIAESVSRLTIAAPRNWSRNVLLWNLAADLNNGPHTPDGGCPVCQGAITIAGDRIGRNLAYYTVAQASKFVPANSVRIASDIATPNTLPNVAFSTPDHHTVLIVANPAHDKASFHVAFHGQQFEAALEAGDVATYVW